MNGAGQVCVRGLLVVEWAGLAEVFGGELVGGI